ncbi:hypothetical protein SDC9_166041 [bioreactor metagenome]|uniref:Uncharacterized protein n=1 Tax=bioreactor metagenome TaxID=1076179 RepID=A0A645FVX6_9ZZZZ
MIVRLFDNLRGHGLGNGFGGAPGAGGTLGAGGLVDRGLLGRRLLGSCLVGGGLLEGHLDLLVLVRGVDSRGGGGRLTHLGWTCRTGLRATTAGGTRQIVSDGGGGFGGRDLLGSSRGFDHRFGGFIVH